jgi:hypothetical protein
VRALRSRSQVCGNPIGEGKLLVKPLTKKAGDQNISPKIDELVLWEVAMQDSPTKAFDPDQLVMLAEVLNEVLSTVELPDDTARQAMAERLGRILMQQFVAGTVDRETLRSLALKASTSDTG